MTETCTFCPAEQWTYLYATDDPFKEEQEIPVCIDCHTAFKQQKVGADSAPSRTDTEDN
jgi:hypothetical protein